MFDIIIGDNTNSTTNALGVVVVVLMWVSSRSTSRKCEYPNVEEEFLEAPASKRKALRKRTHAVVCSKWNDDDDNDDDDSKRKEKKTPKHKP